MANGSKTPENESEMPVSPVEAQNCADSAGALENHSECVGCIYKSAECWKQFEYIVNVSEIVRTTQNSWKTSYLSDGSTKTHTEAQKLHGHVGNTHTRAQR